MEKREEEVEEEESKFVVSSESEINGQGEEGEENHVESQSLTVNDSPVVSATTTTTTTNEVVVANNQSSNAETLIRTQLKQNLKDRLFMLNVEKSLVEFINNDK